MIFCNACQKCKPESEFYFTGEKVRRPCKECKIRNTKRRFAEDHEQTSFYWVWKDMVSRCNNPKHAAYARYGGRGIGVCERWRSFELFKQDMLPRPTGLTLDRADNDGPYSKQNCKWSTRKEQSANRSCSLYLEVGGERFTLKDWSSRSGISYTCLYQRLKAGLAPETIVTKIPAHTSHREGVAL